MSILRSAAKTVRLKNPKDALRFSVGETTRFPHGGPMTSADLGGGLVVTRIDYKRGSMTVDIAAPRAR